MTVWADGDDTTVGMALVDRGTAPESLCDTVTDWYEAAFPDSARAQDDGTTTFAGESQDAVVACPGDQVHVAIAPDVATATTVVP